MRNVMPELRELDPNHEDVAGTLMRHLPRALVLGIEEALTIGAARAWAAARDMAPGHLSGAVGQLRHYHMNQAFHRALAEGGADPSPLCNNRLVIGRTGVLALARFNVTGECWINGRRSATRRQMALANAALEQMVQPELFQDPPPLAAAVVFFIADFARALSLTPERPLSIQIAVPDRFMGWWLFREPIQRFIQRYESPQVAEQEDLAVPTLKTRRQTGTST